MKLLDIVGHGRSSLSSVLESGMLPTPQIKGGLPIMDWGNPDHLVGGLWFQDTLDFQQKVDLG